MAYLSFAPWQADIGTALSSLPSLATPADVARFSPVELRVIDFAKRIDATREIEPQGRLGRFLETILGFRLGRPLADQRLESLRRFASKVSHHGDEVADTDVRSLVEAGYSPGQAYGLLSYLADGRARA